MNTLVNRNEVEMQTEDRYHVNVKYNKELVKKSLQKINYNCNITLHSSLLVF